MKFGFNKAAPAAIALALAAPAARAETATRARFLLGGVLEITANGPDAPGALESAFAEVARIESAISLQREDGELSRLNRHAAFEAVSCSEDLFEVLRAAREVHGLSAGAFDPTFERDRPAPGFAKVRLDEDRKEVEFTAANLRVDLGGIAKGFALDAAARALEERGIRSALLNFGGQIFALGTPPGRPGWDIEVPGAPFFLRLKDQSVSTTSQSERPGSIRDPRTGEAVRRKGSVAAIDSGGARAQAWSIALFVLGVARAPKDFHGCAFETSGGKVAAKTPACAPLLIPKNAQP